MAYLYCSDVQSGYCFSLSRFPDDASIEIMVVDQRTYKVDDLDSVRFTGHSIHVVIDARTAGHLDNATRYDITLVPGEYDADAIRAALEKIFEGKAGYRAHGGES